MAPARIEFLTHLHPGLDVLRAEAEGEGFRFMDRLVAEWRSGVNRFDQPGEVLLGAFRGADLLAVCGLNRDPYADQGGVGRLRHLYVRAAERRGGLTSALVRAALERAGGAFHSVRLRTGTREAAAFYAGHGFVCVEAEKASHVKQLRQQAVGRVRPVPRARPCMDLSGLEVARAVQGRDTA